MVSLIFFLGILFVVSLQPVFMVSSLILITFMYSYSVYIMLGTFWFSYILLMVMLSGVLVVFTYMMTLMPNESFEIFSLSFLMLFVLLIMLYWNYDFKDDMSIVSVNLWITYLGLMSLFMISYLLGIMLVVIVLSCMNDGAFRIEK